MLAAGARLPFLNCFTKDDWTGDNGSDTDQRDCDSIQERLPPQLEAMATLQMCTGEGSPSSRVVVLLRCSGT